MWTIQSNFTKGEIDPQAVARIDLNSYYQGLREAVNVICKPQGGMVKRPGMQFLDLADDDALRLEPFSFSTDVNFIVVFSDQKIQFYSTDGVLVDDIVSPYDDEAVKDLDYIQSYDTIIIAHPNYAPRKIVRNAGSNFVIDTITFKDIPQNNFNDSLSPAGTDEIQRLEFNGIWNAGDTYVLTFNGITTDTISYAGSANAAQQQATIDNFVNALNALPNIGGDGVSATFEQTGPGDSNKYIVTFASNSSEDWSLLTGIPENTANATANIRVQDRIQEGVSRFEPSWSNARGWPQTLTFHENRLWFGGSESLPSTMWGSNVNDFFNFKSYKARDDESITATLDTDQRNAIVGLISNRALQIFTTGQEFYVPESPATPENFSVRAQTNFGSKRVRPITLSGQTLFIQRTGKALNSFVFSEDQQANVTSSVSILSPHLIKDPIKISVQRGAPDSDANYIYIVNSDGTVTVLNSLPYENIAAFTQWITQGEILSCAVVGDKVFFLTLRNGRKALEVENDLLNMDSGKTDESGSTIDNIFRLNDLSIAIKTDGYFYGVEEVDGGFLELSGNYSVIEYGLEFYPKMVTMPMNVNLQTGSALYKKKRLKRVALDIYQSNGIIVNNNRIYDKTIGVNQFSAPIPMSGVKRKYIYGWSVVADITVTQNTPFPFQILSIGVEVAL